MATTRKLFGTDGVRGEANVPPMTPEIVLRLGMAVAAHFGKSGRIVVGKDTRLSGYMFETALAAGLCAVGADVMLVGPLPTPGIAYITNSMRADGGVVVSASHNPFFDNGIKLFARDGFKLPDEVEAHIESLMDGDALDAVRARGEEVGRAVRIDDAAGRYITHLKHSFPVGLSLDGLKVVVDCAHGAAYSIAPTVLAELGAEVIAMGNTPDGRNINDGVGATAPQAMCAKVREVGADIGIALDGDADRSVFSDAEGNVVDGDAILALCARELKLRGQLQGGGAVATVMSNMGLERSLEEVGLSLIRTPVGDRYVVEAMRAGGYNLGGEQSGHVVFLDHATTGDGLVAALQVLKVMRRTGSPLAQLAGVMTRFPQVLESIRVKRKDPIESVPALDKVIRQVEHDLGGDGRVLVRYSGTEPKMRVMLEGTDEARLRELAGRIREVVEAELGAGTAA